jgi:GNAT superfamily N-acetyltransferase
MIAPPRLFAAAEATWPPATTLPLGPWTLRQGLGGGSRVSAATARRPARADELPPAEAAMRAWGQTPLVMVQGQDDALDTLLADAGYLIKDPVTAWAAPVARLATQRPPPVTTFQVWPPLAAQAEIWAAGDIGPARLAVMQRVTGPKTTLLGRTDDKPAASAFVACDGDVAMLHALEVAAPFRGRGLGRHMLTAAAFWAQDQGAAWLALLVTRANAPANALYASAGMEQVAQYHYRIRPE